MNAKLLNGCLEMITHIVISLLLLIVSGSSSWATASTASSLRRTPFFCQGGKAIVPYAAAIAATSISLASASSTCLYLKIISS